MNYKDLIREIPDFPKPGILFRDITPLLAAPEAFAGILDELTAALRVLKPDMIAAIEARGFIFGAPLAYRLGVPFIPVRKPGKLPSKTVSAQYNLEYGSGELQVHADAVRKGARVIVVDDLLATGGTASCAADLIRKCGGDVVAFAFIIELSDLQGRKLLGQTHIQTLLKY